MEKRTSQFLLLIGCVVLSLSTWLFVRKFSGVAGFPLDDAWIHQTYARSLSTADGWSFSPGIASAGATAPLWVLVLVPGYWLNLPPFTWIVVLAALQLFGVAVLAMTAWRLLGLGSAWWGVAAGGLLVFEWHLLWAALSGMETLFYGLAALAVVTILIKLSQDPGSGLWKWFTLGLLVGGVVWVRPEAVTLLGPIWMVAFLIPGETPKNRIKKILASGLGFIVLFAGYLMFNNSLAGSWWPNTFYAKQAEYVVLQEIPFLLRLGKQVSPLVAGVLTVLLPGFVVFVYQSIKQRSWAALSGGIWALGHITMYAYRLPVTYQHGRYVIPALPLLLLLGFAGYYQVLKAIRSKRARWLVSRAWGGALVSFLVVFWILGLQSYVEDIAMIDGEMVRTAEWIEKHTAQDALIAAHDIGALGYFTQRSVVDLAGLVSPDVIPFIRDEALLAGYLDRVCPGFLVTFPDWYTQLPKMGELVFQTDTQVTTEIGGTNMAVYRWIGAGTCP